MNEEMNKIWHYTKDNDYPVDEATNSYDCPHKRIKRRERTKDKDLYQLTMF